MRIIGLAGWSGSGKTTLLTKVIPRLIARGKRVSTLKHAHHDFDVDRPGKDSFDHRSAGATEVLVVSGNRWALMHELRGAPEPLLPDLLAKLSPVDLVAGRRLQARALSEARSLSRRQSASRCCIRDDDWIVAIASDAPLPQATVPVVDLDDIESIADLLLAEAMPIERDRALARTPSDGAAHRRLLRVFRTAAAGRRARTDHRRARRAGRRDRERWRSRWRAAACSRATSARRSTCRRSTIRRSTATRCATPT